MLIALCASREAVSPVTYWHTRTRVELDHSLQAWFVSWQLPARALIGGGKKTPKRPGERATTPQRRDIVDWVPTTRDSRGNVRKRRVYDLREMLPLDREWDPAKVQALKGMMGGKGKTLLMTKEPTGPTAPIRSPRS